MLTAWADESGSRPAPGAYLLAAVLCEDDDIADIRKTMDGLRIGEPKLHWHGSSHERRGHLVEAVAQLPVTGFVVVHIDTDADDGSAARIGDILTCPTYWVPVTVAN